MRCRVCGCDGAAQVATVRGHDGAHYPVADCPDCGSRFTSHRADAHADLHNDPASTYRHHEDLAAELAGYLRAGDASAARLRLSRQPKFRFVFETLEARVRPGARVLELGCARGYLTAALRALGYEAWGSDIDDRVIARAAERFGPWFRYDAANEWTSESWDAIVFVGTVGCVADPEGFVAAAIASLSLGGVVCFNAPEASVVRTLGVPWLPTTRPPDLVTLFDLQWPQRFAAPSVRVESVHSALPVKAGRALRAYARVAPHLPSETALRLGAALIDPDTSSWPRLAAATRGLLARAPAALGEPVDDPVGMRVVITRGSAP